MWIEETKNGKFKFVERYTDYMTGKTKKISVTLDKNTAQSRKTAQKALNEKIDQALGKTFKKEISLKDLIDEYRIDQEKTVKKATYRRNYHTCNAFMRILGENTLVDKLNAKYVRDRFLATGKEPGSLNEYLTRFKAMMRWGYRNDLVSDISFLNKLEPFKDVPHKVKIQDKYLESEELRTLLDGMADDTWRTVTKFLVMSGVRFGEFAALEKSDIDYDNNVIHITKTYDPNNNIVTTPKTTCSVRDVYMQDELKAVCKQLHSQMLRRRLVYSLPDNKLFFFSPDGEHIHYYAYNKYLKENSAKLIGRTITVHALRHTHASLLLEKGIPVETISRRLGHENSKVTKEIYLHVTEKLKEKDNKKIASISII